MSRKAKRKVLGSADGKIQRKDGSLLCSECGRPVTDEDEVAWKPGAYLRHLVCHTRVKRDGRS